MKVIQNIFLLNVLKNASRILKKAEKSIEKDIYDSKLNLYLKTDSKKFLKSVKSNFFTLLMIGILENEKIEKERLLEYAKIIVYMRQLITSTDNMIDNEKKGIIFSKSLKNMIVSNTLINLFCKNSISKSLIILGDKDLKVADELLRYIDSVAISESRRDVVGERYCCSDEIINDIHSGIGGRLLELSLIAPTLLEKIEIKEKLEKYSKGLYWIGMALQELDDFLDMKEDYINKKYNLYIGKYYERFKTLEKELEKNLDNREMFANIFFKDLKNIKINTVRGLEILKSEGFPINDNDYKPFLKELLKERKINKEFELIFD